jgi:hypothetical protein
LKQVFNRLYLDNPATAGIRVEYGMRRLGAVLEAEVVTGNDVTDSVLDRVVALLLLLPLLRKLSFTLHLLLLGKLCLLSLQLLLSLELLLRPKLLLLLKQQMLLLHLLLSGQFLLATLILLLLAQELLVSIYKIFFRRH